MSINLAKIIFIFPIILWLCLILMLFTVQIDELCMNFCSREKYKGNFVSGEKSGTLNLCFIELLLSNAQNPKC